MPLSRRLPKRGFRSRLCKEIVTLNVETLNRFQAGIVIDENQLKETGLVKSSAETIKILGKGEIDHPLTVKVKLISQGAKAKIEAAGGSVIEVI